LNYRYFATNLSHVGAVYLLTYLLSIAGSLLQSHMQEIKVTFLA